MTYKIVRFFGKKGTKRTINSGLTLEEARKHCNDPEASSKTAKSKSGRARTSRHGTWFDGFTAE
jgi:hypothetical protein